MTALMVAAQYNRPRIIQLLLNADGSIEHLMMEDEDGDTALTIASSYGNYDTVDTLLKIDSSAEHISHINFEGYTALACALLNKDAFVVSKLIAHGATFFDLTPGMLDTLQPIVQAALTQNKTILQSESSGSSHF